MRQRTASARWRMALVAVLLGLGAPAASRGDGFELNVRPLLQKHCLRCHGEREAEGGHQPGAVRATRSRSAAIPISGSGWSTPWPSGSMPPPGNRAGPNEDERQRAAASIQADPRRDRRGQRPRPQPDPAPDPSAIQQHDPRPARRRLPTGRRLPRRRRRRRRVRQQRLDPVRPADPDGEVPGRGGRRAREGRPGAVPRRPARRADLTEGRGRPALHRARSPAAPSAARSATPRSTA